jgi:hypothetical protein
MLTVTLAHFLLRGVIRINIPLYVLRSNTYPRTLPFDGEDPPKFTDDHVLPAVHQFRVWPSRLILNFVESRNVHFPDVSIHSLCISASDQRSGMNCSTGNGIATLRIEAGSRLRQGFLGLLGFDFYVFLYRSAHYIPEV